MKVAIVGSGCSGLGALWLLSEHSEHEAHLYEADSRFGGHANTVDFVPNGKTQSEAVPVDTGFIVLNPSTYPNFLRFLQLKNVKTIPTEMTFAVSRDGGRFEWAGKNLFSLVCQPKRIFDENIWRLVYDVLRFNACAGRLLNSSRSSDYNLSIGQYVKEHDYSDSFRDNYLIPMTAAIWSTPPDMCALDFPARTLVQFLHNHHLLQLLGKPSWLTIEGGSKVYVNKTISAVPKSRLHLSSPVTSLSSNTADAHSSVKLQTADGKVEEYDHVILACHSDTALQILCAGAGGATEDEESILGKFQWNRNEAVLHSDSRLMPRSRLAWSCWNYLTTSQSGSEKSNNKADTVALTYWMNDLQHIPEATVGPIFVTLNPPFEPAAHTIHGRWSYDHPVLDSQAIHAQSQLPLIQNTRGISYAGAYTKYGFHEDGFASGLRAASSYLPDVHPPFALREPDRRVSTRWTALLFDVLEFSGARSVAGLLLGWLLACVLFFVRLFVRVEL